MPTAPGSIARVRIAAERIELASRRSVGANDSVRVSNSVGASAAPLKFSVHLARAVFHRCQKPASSARSDERLLMKGW